MLNYDNLSPVLKQQFHSTMDALKKEFVQPAKEKYPNHPYHQEEAMIEHILMREYLPLTKLAGLLGAIRNGYKVTASNDCEKIKISKDGVVEIKYFDWLCRFVRINKRLTVN